MKERSLARSLTRSIDSIVDSYEQQSADYEELQRLLESSLARIKATCPAVHSFRSRLKDPDHLRDKLIRRWRARANAGKSFDITADNMPQKLNDLVGGRILHLHTKQFPEIHLAIKKTFSKNGYDILNRGPEATVWDPEYKALFGNMGIRCRSKLSLYSSVHYEFRAPGRAPRLTCELQVRTLAEELWGETDHSINYPQPSASAACREQILVLARATSTCTRLVDAIAKVASTARSAR